MNALLKLLRTRAIDNVSKSYLPFVAAFASAAALVAASAVASVAASVAASVVASVRVIAVG